MVCNEGSQLDMGFKRVFCNKSRFPRERRRDTEVILFSKLSLQAMFGIQETEPVPLTLGPRERKRGERGGRKRGDRGGRGEEGGGEDLMIKLYMKMLRETYQGIICWERTTIFRSGSYVHTYEISDKLQTINNTL